MLTVECQPCRELRVHNSAIVQIIIGLLLQEVAVLLEARIYNWSRGRIQNFLEDTSYVPSTQAVGLVGAFSSMCLRKIWVTE